MLHKSDRYMRTSFVKKCEFVDKRYPEMDQLDKLKALERLIRKEMLE